MIQSSRTTRAQRAEAARLRRERRQAVAREVAASHDGVATWTMLVEAGLSRGEIQGELDRGTWQRLGRHTIGVPGAIGVAGAIGVPGVIGGEGANLARTPGTQEPRGTARWWWALWESGQRSVLDGSSSLLAAGLKSWTEDIIHVTVPNNAAVRPLEGVQHHLVRRRGEAIMTGLRRTKPPVAVIRAAQWARSDRQAATLVAMTVQQRLASPTAVLDRWAEVSYSARRATLDRVVRDVCDGAHSLSELDFAVECRRRGLPEPSRQVVRTGANGRIYLDVFWDELRVHVEIQGAHHFVGTAGLDDALRFNDVGLRDPEVTSLQIPVLGLRTMPDRFMDQVAAALELARSRVA